AIAAGNDHHVVLADLDHRQSVVDRGMHDVECARCETVALAARILREMKFNLQSVLFDNDVGNAGMERHCLGVGKRVDAQHLCLVGPCRPGDSGTSECEAAAAPSAHPADADALAVIPNKLLPARVADGSSSHRRSLRSLIHSATAGSARALKSAAIMIVSCARA